MDYDEVRARLEEAYRRCDRAEDFLQEILRLWAEYGIIQGDCYCSLEKVV